MNRRSVVMLALVVCMMISGWMASPAAGEMFTDANQLYKENKYDEAVEAYERILRAGLESGNLYYNLGNSYFKKGDYGRALLNYERARIFIPRDSDVLSNYDFVRGVVNVPPRYAYEPWFFRWLDRLFDGISLNALTAGVSVLWVSLLLFLAWLVRLPAVKRFSVPGIGILIVFLVICSAALARKIFFFEHGAVVTVKEAEVKFEPAAKATTYFKITEGNPVFVLERSAEWVKIRRPDSRIGWVPSSAVTGIRMIPGGDRP